MLDLLALSHEDLINLLGDLGLHLIQLLPFMQDPPGSLQLGLLCLGIVTEVDRPRLRLCFISTPRFTPKPLLRLLLHIQKNRGIRINTSINCHEGNPLKSLTRLWMGMLCWA